MKLANIEFEPNLVVAPMAGISSAPFRMLCRRYGAGMSFSELVSSNALIMGGEKSQEKSRQLAWFSEEERPVAVQIFGADPVMMREAAALVAATKPDAIDINMGCSVKKIAKCGAGCLLMKTPDLAEKIIAATIEGLALAGTEAAEPGIRLDRIALEGGRFDLREQGATIESIEIAGVFAKAWRSISNAVRSSDSILRAAESPWRAPASTSGA